MMEQDGIEERNLTPKQQNLAMSASQLILHIGPHKTGTSAIQSMLAAAASPLKSDGWHYEAFDQFPGGAHGVADQISHGRHDAVREFIHGLGRKHPNSVISSENFSRLDRSGVEFLVDCMGFSSIKVVYFLRNPMFRLESEWRERVKHGYRHTFLEFLSPRLLQPVKDRTINETLKLNPWRDVVGIDKIDVHLYDRVTNSISRFLEFYFPFLAGSRFDANERINKSIGIYRTEIYRALKGHQRRLPDAPDVERRVAMLEKYMRDPKFEQHRKSITTSMAYLAFATLEKAIIQEYGSSIVDSFDKHLFKERVGKWEFISPHIWDDTHAFSALSEIAATLQERFGAPQVDARLSAL